MDHTAPYGADEEESQNERRIGDRRGGLRGPRDWARNRRVTLSISQPYEGEPAEHTVWSSLNDPGHGPRYMAHRHRRAPGVRQPASDARLGCGRESQDAPAALVRGVVACCHRDDVLERSPPFPQPPPRTGAVGIDGCRRAVLEGIHVNNVSLARNGRRLNLGACYLNAS